MVGHALWSRPGATPALGDVSAYPRALIIAGDADAIVDANRAFAAKLEVAGRRITLMVQPERPHGDCFFAKILPQGEAAFAVIRAFVEGMGRRAPGRGVPALGMERLCRHESSSGE